MSVLKEISRCAKGINNNVIEHTAYLRGSAAKNDIDMEKYREEVRKEIEGDQKSQNKGEAIYALCDK